MGLSPVWIYWRFPFLNFSTFSSLPPPLGDHFLAFHWSHTVAKSLLSFLFSSIAWCSSQLLVKSFTCVTLHSKFHTFTVVFATSFASLSQFVSVAKAICSVSILSPQRTHLVHLSLLLPFISQRFKLLHRSFPFPYAFCSGGLVLLQIKVQVL